MGNSQSQDSVYSMPKFNENEYQQLKSIIGEAEQTSMNDFIPVSTDLLKEKLPYFTERFKVTLINLTKEEEKLLNIKYKNIKKSKKKALEKSLSAVSLTFETKNEILSRSSLIRIIEGLCKPTEDDPDRKIRKRFIQLYASTFSNDKEQQTNEEGEKEIVTTNTFIKELASTALTYYVAAVPKIKKVEKDDQEQEIIKEAPAPKFLKVSERIVNFILRDIKKVSVKEDLSKPVNFDDNEDEESTKVNEPIILSWEDFIKYCFESSPFSLLWEIAFCSAFITTSEFKARNFKNYRLKSMTKPRLNPNRSRLLTPEDLFIIDLSIPSFHLSEGWNQLYDSSSSGENWTVFSNCIEDQGSTIVIVRDKNDNVFGGFASHEWELKPKFYGDNRSFLFTLRPEINIYKATEINDHYQYFNDQSKSFPNGLGMGGQLDYFGFFISSDFQNGHSKGVSTTYNNSSLCGQNDFKLDAVEVWLVKEKERDDRLIDDKKLKQQGSIMDRMEDMTFLEMSGVKMYSKDIKKQPNADDEYWKDSEFDSNY
ncbi:TLD-domain-containing protein [Anaeromyces robustus]|uniref:MTOR-associated protein MEAK7 n=1 Tax=Anaeromyces robustus TaxID=1754192 RepID=A0A1Y1XM23_9FUNG|nr:TLD-domain-containing protein [Anaeromyces robustus]|eukprot:ORX86745.1 TLD-domain-containing protein [Anaeromyces robustus]